jgi:DNA-binding transcriptional LysR family regulator
MLDPKLYTLLQVYECRSFSGAAKKLSVTQPAVSHHIKALEQELNVRIFDRTSGPLLVTREGEEVVECAKKMAGLYHSLKQSLTDTRMMATHLTVGITHTAESSPVVEALAKYCAEYDHINMKMITSPISELYDKLKSYEIDLAVVEGRGHDPDIRYELLDTDHLELAAAVHHPLAKKRMVTLHDLKQERLILRLPNSGTRNLFVSHLESNDMSIDDFNVILELDNISTIKDLIRRGFGVSVLPKSVCLEELKKRQIAVLPVENLTMTREINLAYHKDFMQSTVSQDIVRVYQEVLRTYKMPQKRA